MKSKRQLDAPLRRDVRFLGQILGEVLVEQEGEALFALEERVRKLAIRRRRGPKAGRADAARELAELIQGLPGEQAEPVIRAFAIYFQLVNVAEQHHRVRRARAHASNPAPHPEPQRGSLLAIMALARARGVSAPRMREALGTLNVTLTFTAHPTQAIRRTVLEKLDRMSQLLEESDRCQLTPAEKQASLAAMREEITALWQTDEVRHERPTVADEVKTVLWYVEGVLWDLLPVVPEALAQAFERTYGEPLGFLPQPMRLHSWVGGDMDGNPLVTPEVLEDAIRAHLARGLRQHLLAVRRLGRVLSQSSRHVEVPAALVDSLAEDARQMPEVAAQQGPKTAGEPWRRKLKFIEARLGARLFEVEQKRALAGSGDQSLDTPAPSGRPYLTPEEFAHDLLLVANTLHQAGAAKAGERRARALLSRVRSLGLHVAELEMRVPAEDARAAARTLTEGAEPTDGARRLIESLRRVAQAQREGGEPACRTFILSMCHSAEDVLAAWTCARELGLYDAARGCVTMDVVPLLETLEDLDAGEAILAALFAHPGYRRHLDARDGQEVMVGYSDSGKEVGLLAAAGALRRAERALPKLAREAGVPLWLFHGRGETVARGGGPAQQAILALPPGAVAGRYKATEQGEALDHKYARPELAMRSLELTIGGALLHSLDAQGQPPEEDVKGYAEDFETLAADGRRAYRRLVWEEPLFVEFFNTATPVAEIGRLPIGSRPSKRHAGGLEALRAIPWVFGWTQNRAILPGWYGVGTALETMGKKPGGLERLKEMYARWPFFHTVLDNVEMVLAKSDVDISARYATLASPEARKAVWIPLRRELLRTRRWIKRINGSRQLLDGNPPLQRSIKLRNPYVDPMSFLQVELLKRKRAGDASCDRPLLLTLAGIAAGMRNTG